MREPAPGHGSSELDIRGMLGLERLGAACARLDEARLQASAREMRMAGARVFALRRGDGASWSLPVAYENGRWIVYEVPRAPG